MRTLKAKLSRTAAVLAATLAFGTSAFGSVVVYDNSDIANYIERSIPLANQAPVGDEIFLSGGERFVTDFRFTIYADTATLSGNETITLFLHANDGLPPGESPRKAPGTVLFQEEFAVRTDPLFAYQTFASIPNIAVPDNFTWTVMVTGLEPGERVELPIFTPPTIGSSYIDFWAQTETGWQLFLAEGGAIDATFSARITAVPEPSTYALAAMGLAIAGFVGYRRRSS